MELFGELFGNVLNFTWQQGLMVLIGFVLIYLAIKHDMEPALLLPMGFGAVLVNLPFVNTEAIETLFNAGIASELFPLLLFIGIGAMIDFGPCSPTPRCSSLAQRRNSASSSRCASPCSSGLI